MTTAEIYQLAIDLGLKADLRGQRSVKEHLNYAKRQYRQLDKKAKATFRKQHRRHSIPSAVRLSSGVWQQCSTAKKTWNR